MLTVQSRDVVELIILKRKGFVREALKSGAYLGNTSLNSCCYKNINLESSFLFSVPSFSFNESLLMDPIFPMNTWFGKKFRAFQEWSVTNLRWPMPIFNARGVFQYRFGTIPNRLPITVVGKSSQCIFNRTLPEKRRGTLVQHILCDCLSI